MVGQTIKPGFKKTEIGEIPEEWKLKPLEQLCEIYDNERIPLSDKIRKNRKGFFPYCGANGIVDYIDDYLFDGEFVLLAEDGGYYGKSEPSAYLMKGKFWVNNHAHVLRGIQDEMENGFLLNSLIYLDIARYIFGTTRLKLNQQVMRSILLAVPNFNEQQKIAKILSNTDSLIESLDKLISKKRNIKQGLMQTLLTRGIGHTKFKKTEIGEIPEEWEISLLSNCSVKIVDRDHRTPKYAKQGFPLVSPENFFGVNNIDFSECRRISEEELLLDRKKCDPIEGDILFSRIGTIGLVRLIETERIFSVLHSIALIRPNEKNIEKEFLFQYLQFKVVQNQIKKVTQSIGTPDVGIEKIRSLIVSIPSIHEQQKIAEILSDADKEIEVLEQKRYKYEMLKTGMMQQLLTGGIRVK